MGVEGDNPLPAKEALLKFSPDTWQKPAQVSGKDERR